MSPIFEYIIQRLREPSSWIGLITALSGSAYYISPEAAQEIAVIASSLVGLILTLTKDSHLFGGTKDKKHLDP